MKSGWRKWDAGVYLRRVFCTGPFLSVPLSASCMSWGEQFYSTILLCQPHHSPGNNASGWPWMAAFERIIQIKLSPFKWFVSDICHCDKRLTNNLCHLSQTLGSQCDRRYTPHGGRDGSEKPISPWVPTPCLLYWTLNQDEGHDPKFYYGIC
jgi:hypothetical protein